MRILIGTAMLFILSAVPVARAQQAGMNVAIPAVVPAIAKSANNPTPGCMPGFDQVAAAGEIVTDAVATAAATYAYGLASTIPIFGQVAGAAVAAIVYEVVNEVLGELWGRGSQSHANCAALAAFVPEAAEAYRFHNFVRNTSDPRTWRLAYKNDWWAEVGWARFDPEFDTIWGGGAGIPENVKVIVRQFRNWSNKWAREATYVVRWLEPKVIAGRFTTASELELLYFSTDPREFSYSDDVGETWESIHFNLADIGLEYQVARGDVNDDGLDDVVYLDEKGDVFVLYGMEELWTEQMLRDYSHPIFRFPTTENWGFLEVADYDGDGMADVGYWSFPSNAEMDSWAIGHDISVDLPQMTLYVSFSSHAFADMENAIFDIQARPWVEHPWSIQGAPIGYPASADYLGTGRAAISVLGLDMKLRVMDAQPDAIPDGFTPTVESLVSVWGYPETFDVFGTYKDNLTLLAASGHLIVYDNFSDPSQVTDIGEVLAVEAAFGVPNAIVQGRTGGQPVLYVLTPDWIQAYSIFSHDGVGIVRTHPRPFP